MLLQENLLRGKKWTISSSPDVFAVTQSKELENIGYCNMKRGLLLREPVKYYFADNYHVSLLGMFFRVNF